MTTAQAPRRERWLFILQSAILLAIAFFSTLEYIRNHYQPGTIVYLSEYIAGTWDRPFVYRLLTMLVLRGLVALGLAPYPAVYLQLHASVIGFVLAFWYLARALTEKKWFAFAASCLIVPTIYPVLFFKILYVYDFAITFLFTLGLLLIHRRNWKAFLLLFPLICITKETAILLTLLFLVFEWRVLPRRQYLGLLGIQGLTYLLIRLALGWVFRDNPGFDLPSNIHVHVYWARQEPLAGIVYLLVFFLLLGMFYRWKEKPEFLRNATLLLLPLTGLYLVGGFPLEFRVFAEVFPVLFLLFLWPIALIHLRPPVREGKAGKPQA